MLLDGCPQMFGIEVGIDFGCEDALVAQQLLYLTNTRPALQEVGGKGVAQGVGADTLIYTRILGCTADDIKDHNTRKAATSV